MKTGKVFMLVIFFSILIFVNLLVFAGNSEKQASDFQSNGDLIEGWYWLRDSALQHYGEWTFENIPSGSENLILNVNALATDRPNGGRGFSAKFSLIYGFPGSGNMGGVFKTKIVTLPNVSPPDDPLGYTCQGQVTIDREFISGATNIVFRVKRGSAQDNHVAFKKESIILLIEDVEEIEEMEEAEEEQVLEGEQLPETDVLEGANLIQSGTYTGSLGEEDSEGHRNNDDYYQIYIEKGQLITLQLTIPGNASYNISLLNPNHNSRGFSITQREIKTLDYVADSTGIWYIRVSRSSGEGDYQLSIDIQDQDDAASGQDAGDSYQGAIPISPPGGTFAGLLKAGDNYDYYSISLEKGQQINLQLKIPGNASYSLSLLNPNRYSRGSSITQRDIKTLDYVADSTGTWYIMVSRSSGEGEYQLSVEIENQNDADSGHDAGDSYQQAVSISAGTLTGLLKAGDNYDYYSISLEKGQQINLQLKIPGNASYSLSLLNPNRYSRGSSITQRDIKTLDYVADSTGTWYIMVSRSSGEGEYQLAVNSDVTSLEAIEDSEISSVCTYTLSSYEWRHVGFSGGVSTIYITTSSPDCQWTAEIDVPWIQIFAGSSGSGTGSKVLEYSVSNNNGAERTGHITIGDQVHTVIQNGIPGNIQLSRYTSNFSSSGGTGEFTVSPSYSGYQWTAEADASWIQIDSGGSGPGSQTLHFSIQNNNSNTERTGQILIDNQVHIIKQQPKLELTLSDQGRILTSNLPIFVEEDKVGNLEIDADGDGILQEWEDKAMDYTNPYIELDEEEDWLTRKNTDHVANFVRVHPYPDFYYVPNFSYHSGNLPEYIIFRYVVTWSFDYGRFGFMGHDGDHERIFMAWKVINNNTLRLEWVFTSSHRDPNAHHGVWNAWHSVCNKGDVAFNADRIDHSEVMCSNLQFVNNRLLVYASEDKHAIYPSCDVCEDVNLWINLAGEDCAGGGTFRFDCYNVGEPPGFIDPKVYDLSLDEGKLVEVFPEIDYGIQIFTNKLLSRYRIQIKTGDKDLAGTDAKISIKLFGSDGTSPWYEIYSTPRPPSGFRVEHLGTFEKGDTDNIFINSLDLGEINKIQIKHDNSGVGPGWFISEILVEDLETNTTWYSRPNTWLEKGLLKDNTDKTFNLELMN